jgi:lipopolysaccharide biosynthesis glycosyltransferase
MIAAADQKFATQLMVSLHSALVHLDRSRPAYVYVIDGGICPEDLSRIESCLSFAHPLGSIMTLKPDTSRISGLHATGRFSTATYLRLLIESMLPGSVDKILYLDSDVVVTDDVSALFDIDLGGKAIGAVQEVGDHAGRLTHSLPGQDVPDDLPYFNAGVMLIDLPEWRRQRVSERAFALLDRHGERLRWSDQDALNLAVAGKWGAVSQRWNNIIAGQRFRFPDLWSRGGSRGVLHFVGDRKPWHSGKSCRRKHLYLYALARTAWFGLPRRSLLLSQAGCWAVHDHLQSVYHRIRDAVGAPPKRQPAG